MKGNRLEKQVSAWGDHHCICIVDTVDRTYFLHHWSIWEYAALLNYEGNLGDLSLDKSWTARGCHATIVCKGTTVSMVEMRGLIN